MTRKTMPSDRASEQADYAAWKITAGADLLGRHDVKPGIIPERVWKKLYIEGRSPQGAADRVAVSAHKAQSPADRLRKLKLLKRGARP
jgi:hypothetical protein